MKRLLQGLLLALALMLAAPTVLAADAADAADATHAAAADNSERLQVNAPFIELHTGPGRGYPVSFVAERHQWLRIEMRHTDWYRVRVEGSGADRERVGWVPRQQLESTLTEAGRAKSFRDVLIDDYLARRIELGAAWGRFKSEPMLKVWSAWRFSDTLAVEATLGQVQGLFSGSDFWHVGLSVEPWSDHRLSPYLGVGLGRFNNIPNTSLVNAQTNNANLANAALGLRYHLGERFVARLDYTLYTAFVADTHSSEYRTVTLGLSFFF